MFFVGRCKTWTNGQIAKKHFCTKGHFCSKTLLHEEIKAQIELLKKY